MNGLGTRQMPRSAGARRAPPARPRSGTDTAPTASVPRSRAGSARRPRPPRLGQAGVLAQVARDEEAPLAVELHLDRPRAHESAELSCGRVGRRQALDLRRQLLPGVATERSPGSHPASERGSLPAPGAAGSGPGPRRGLGRPARAGTPRSGMAPAPSCLSFTTIPHLAPFGTTGRHYTGGESPSRGFAHRRVGVFGQGRRARRSTGRATGRGSAQGAGVASALGQLVLGRGRRSAARRRAQVDLADAEGARVREMYDQPARSPSAVSQYTSPSAPSSGSARAYEKPSNDVTRS